MLEQAYPLQTTTANVLSLIPATVFISMPRKAAVPELYQPPLQLPPGPLTDVLGWAVTPNLCLLPLVLQQISP